MSIRIRRIALCLAAMLPGLALAYAPTPHAMNFYGYAALNEKPAPVGTVVTAHDPAGIECGKWVVSAEERYGIMPCYGDDPATPADEGAVAGDRITFKINGYDAVAVGSTMWSNMGQEQVNLSLVITPSSPPPTETSMPPETTPPPKPTEPVATVEPWYTVAPEPGGSPSPPSSPPRVSREEAEKKETGGEASPPTPKAAERENDAKDEGSGQKTIPLYIIVLLIIALALFAMRRRS